MADPRGRFARATQLLQQAATASRSTRQALGTFTRLELLSRCKDAVQTASSSASGTVPALSSSAGSPRAADTSDASETGAALDLIQQAAAEASSLPKELYSDVGGNPASPVDERSQETAEHFQSVQGYAGILQALLSHAGLAARLSSAALGSATDADQKTQSPQHSRPKRRVVGGVEIEELPAHDEHRLQQQRAQETEAARLKQLAVDVVLLVATYSSDCRLEAPWTSSAVAASVTSLLQPIAAMHLSQPSAVQAPIEPRRPGHASQPATAASNTSAQAAAKAAPKASPGRKPLPPAQVLKSQPLVKRPLIEELEDSNGSETSSEASSGAASEAAATPQMMAPPASAAAAAATTTGSPAAAAASATEQRPLELRVQDLLLALLPEVVRRLRATIMQKGHTGSEAGFKPYTGPDTFDRALAARRLGWVVRQLGYTHLTPAIPAVLPSILAAVDDVSPPVQSLGLWTLHHLATEALPSDLRWQRELLLDVAKRSISGCDERVWPAAAPTATALAIALEGKDPYAAGYDLIMRGMLEEGERHAHVPARRIVWLRAIQPLLQALALVNVRYLGRLLPLLLQWLQEFDRPSRTGALQALHCVIQQTWPRIPAHADLLWQHLQWAHDREKGAPESAEQPAAVQWIERCAELLAWCSRDFVQQRLAAGDLERESLLRYGLAVEQ